MAFTGKIIADAYFRSASSESGRGGAKASKCKRRSASNGSENSGAGVDILRYVDVIIDNASDYTDRMYTYAEGELSISKGMRVKVPFGKRDKLVMAYVFDVYEEDRLSDDIKDVNIKNVAGIDEELFLTDELLKLVLWIRRTCVCRYIEAIKCMIPPYAKPDSGRKTAGGRKNPYENIEVCRDAAPKLTDEQQKAVGEILPKIESKAYGGFLLNGVTGSGKTEIYICAAQRALEIGRQVIIIVPEISLASQMIEQFIARFGIDRIAILHSRLTKRQRYDQWMRVRRGEADIVIGARIGIFAPFEDPGLIVVDECHEAAYKSDMTPKYDAVEAAVFRGKSCGSPVIMGSATPSVAQRYRALQGEFQEIRLNERFNKTPLPRIEIADMRSELSSGNRSIFSRRLYQSAMESLKAGKQVLLFVNKRGYSSFVSCRSCGYAVKCDACGITMTYHKTSGKVECHYCGRKKDIPQRCPSCGSPYIRHFGIGTEKVEESAREAFEGYNVARLDLDAAKKKGESDRIIKAFKKGKTDILVGTQIVAKGLDYQNVGTVGIISADIMLNIPDYRSSERTFQTIVQAAGRAGRRNEQGSVIIQTYSPDEKVLRYAAAADSDRFYENEIMLRRLTGYPPFTNIIRLVFYFSDENILRREAQEVYFTLRDSEFASKGEVFAPVPARKTKMNDNYRYQFIVKSPLEKTEKYLTMIAEIKSLRALDKKTKSVMLVEVDPYSMS